MQNDDNTLSRNDCLVEVSGKVYEDVHGEPVGWNVESQLGDSATVTMRLVTNTPGDLIGIASLRIIVMGDGFYLVSRTTVGGDSQFIASGKLDAIDGVQHYGREYAALQRAIWLDRQLRP